jgi:cell division protein FtsX
MGASARAAWVFVFAAAAALAAQTLILVERQCRSLEAALSDDFRVVLFLHGPLDAGRRTVLEEKLRALPEAAEVRYVGPDEGIATVRREDPDLIDAVALVGDNPLPGAYEIKPTPDALPRLASWMLTLQGMADWSDVRWKPAELQAILRARLYGHWLRLALSTLLCAAALLALWALGLTTHAPRRGHSAGLSLAGLCGGGAGLAFSALVSLPLRRDGVLWSAAPWWTQAGVAAACAVLGWSLALWRAEP